MILFTVLLLAILPLVDHRQQVTFAVAVKTALTYPGKVAGYPTGFT